MLKNLQENFLKNAHGHANWMQLALFVVEPFYEIAIAGPDFISLAGEIYPNYLPNTIFAGSGEETELSLLKNRFVEDRTLVYVCLQGACKLPVTQSKEVLTQLK